MVPTPARTARPARPVPALLLAVLVPVLLAVGLLPAPAHAADRTVAGGRLDWGIRSSFLNYVTGPIAQGSWGLSGGASTVGAGQFRFHTARGSYDPDTGTVRAQYAGGVRFYGHQDASGSYELDMTFSNPAVEITGGSGVLRADVRSKDRDTGKVSDRTAVAFATLDLSGVNLRGGTQISVSGVPATLSAEGATAFGGFYAAGEALDPVTFTADTQAQPDPEPAPAPDEDPEPGPEPSGPGAEEPDEPAEGPVEIADAAVDWGVRRTFREFVTGDIAQGAWQLAEGAEDGGALFRFSRGEGGYDPGDGTVEAAFAGSLHFTGNDLDLRLSAVTVEVADGVGILSADVATGAKTSPAQPLVTFAVPELVAEDGLLLVTEAPAELTEAGAEAFGGLYPPGTAMDPVSLAVALDETAGLPGLPDLGAEPPAEDPGPEPEPSGPAPDDAEPESAVSSSRDTTLLTTGGAALAVLAVAGYLVLRRMRARRTAAPPADTGPDGQAAQDEQADSGKHTKETPEP